MTVKPSKPSRITFTAPLELVVWLERNAKAQGISVAAFVRNEFEFRRRLEAQRR